MIRTAAGLTYRCWFPVSSSKHTSLVLVPNQFPTRGAFVARRLGYTIIIPRGRIFIKRGRIITNTLPPQFKLMFTKRAWNHVHPFVPTLVLGPNVYATIKRWGRCHDKQPIRKRLHPCSNQLERRSFFFSPVWKLVDLICKHKASRSTRKIGIRASAHPPYGRVLKSLLV